MHLELSALDMAAVRNALAVRLVQLEHLVRNHDCRHVQLLDEGHTWESPEVLRNHQHRASMLYELARVEHIDSLVLAATNQENETEE